ncbi:MAG: hypothetical protein KGJ66_06320 [Alphaproteobacteria bacterium]|nr:hypothetical protein [Alphaproteobacteria bacterium]
MARRLPWLDGTDCWPQFWAMTVKERQTPGRGDSGTAKAAAKEARLAEALRANLARRKAQARARAPDAGDTPPPKKPAGSA